MADSIWNLQLINRRDSSDFQTTDEIVTNILYAQGLQQTKAFADMTTDQKTALALVNDMFTYLFEAGAFVWKCAFDGVNEIDFTSSYMRDDEDTTLCSAFAGGEGLTAVFEVPGFAGNTIVEISLWYGDAFLPADLTALAGIGVTLTGDGDVFTVANTKPTKISFRRPDLIADQYIIVQPEIILP